MSYTLLGVLGTFRGGLGGVETSAEFPLSCPKTEGENGELGPECSVLNRSIFLLGLNGDPLPAGEEKHPKSVPKSSAFNNLKYASLPPPSFTGDSFSVSPKVCSLDDDLQGINLSLHLPDFDEGDERFDMVLGDLVLGEGKFDTDLTGEPDDKVCRRRVVSDIEAGRLIPLFLL